MSEEEKTVPQSHAFAALDVLRITKDQLEAAENEIRHFRLLIQNIEQASKNKNEVFHIRSILSAERERTGKYRYLLHRKPVSQDLTNTSEGVK